MSFIQTEQTDRQTDRQTPIEQYLLGEEIRCKGPNFVKIHQCCLELHS